MRTALAAATATLLLTVCTACTGSDDPDDGAAPAPVGAVVPTLGFDIEGYPSHVVVPGRRFNFAVSSPRDRMDSTSAAAAGFDDEAGDGRAFVGIRWSLEAVAGQAGLVMAPDPDLPVTATLLVDGERRDLGDLLAEGARGAYVVVPEDADDIGLEVEYDGRAQVLDDAYDPVLGRPTGIDELYNEAPVLTRPVVPDTRRDGRLSWGGAGYALTISSPVPYYGPVGWAPAGAAWVTARVVVTHTDGLGVDTPDAYVDYEVTGEEPAVTLDGAEPDELLPDDDPGSVGEQDDGSWRAVAVFLVRDDDTPDELVVARAYRADAEDPDEAAGAGEPRRRTLRDRVVVRAS